MSQNDQNPKSLQASITHFSINQEKLIIEHSEKSVQTLHFKFYLVFKRDSMNHLQESFPNN